MIRSIKFGGSAKKGQVTVIYTIFLALILVIVVGTLLRNVWFFNRAQVTDIDFKDSIFVLRNAVKTANFYIEGSLDYSVYQAMYDNGMHGGFEQSGSAYYVSRLECQELFESACVSDDRSVLDIAADLDTTVKSRQIGMIQCILGKMVTGTNTYFTGDVNCEFGSDTQNALKSFQKDNSLTETGLADKQTLEKLREKFTWDNCGDFFTGCYNRFLIIWNSVPEKDAVENKLKSAVLDNLKKYVGDTGTVRYFFGKAVGIPKMTLSKFEQKDGMVAVGIAADGSDYISGNQVTEKESISLRLAPAIEKTYTIRYFELYEKAKEKFNQLGRTCTAETTQDAASKISIKVELIAPTYCKITVTDESLQLPVYDGKAASMQYISFVFLKRTS